MQEKTFNNFVAPSLEDTNLSLAQAMARTSNYSVAMFFGESGTGKTHLLSAISHDLATRGEKFKHCTGSEFNRTRAEADENNFRSEFLRSMTDCEVLIVDDFDALLTNENSASLFQEIFDILHSKHSRLVVAASRSLRDLPVTDKLRTRLSWGICSRTSFLSHEASLLLARRLADLHGIKSLPKELAAFIGVTEQMRRPAELEGLILQFSAAVKEDRNVTAEIYNSVMRARSSASRALTKRVSVDDVIEVVCEYYNVLMKDLLSPRRTKNLAFPRHVAMYLAKEVTALTLTEIGSFFGGRDHSTVLHAINKIKGLHLKDDELRTELQRLKDLITATSN